MVHQGARERALDYLLGDPLYYMSMIAPLRRNSIEILAVDDVGVMLRDELSGALMLISSNVTWGMRELSKIPRADLVLLHQASLIDFTCSRFGIDYVHTCLQAVFFHRHPLPLSSNLHCEELHAAHFASIWKHYHTLVDRGYLLRRLEAGALMGGFVGSELVGFIGEHEEGSIGMLEVLPQHRRNGYGSDLVAAMVNRQLNRGLIPFAQITPGNEASLSLFGKLGFTVGSEQLYWLFNTV